MRVLITGGAGFVGSWLARCFRDDGAEVVAFDNLRRRGSELNLPDFKKRGIEFAHGDIRQRADLEAVGDRFDLLVEASAEPSVLAGLNASPDYLLQTNLTGTLNALDYARTHAGAFLFLSTSRVYSIEALRAIPLRAGASRFELDLGARTAGLSERGISEDFSVATARSLYGATKLASELFLQEYASTYGLKTLVNRCGVLAGPGQFGKVDQGVFTLWMARHYFQKPLRYTGFGGRGLQVRDLLHPRDLYALIRLQIAQTADWEGQAYNVGGGLEVSVSMRELTALCQKISGRSVACDENPESHAVDIPFYVSDCRRVQEAYGWKASSSTTDIFREIHSWIASNEDALRPIFA